MANDQDRIRAAIDQRIAETQNAAARERQREAETERRRAQGQQWAHQFGTAVAAIVRATVEAPNRGDLPKAGFSIAVASTSISSLSTQAPSLTYAVKSAAGERSVDMLVFAHVGADVLIDVRRNPHAHGRGRQFFDPSTFPSRRVSIATFTAADADRAFADFVEFALPTFPV
jgi:hypothetical protein